MNRVLLTVIFLATVFPGFSQLWVEDFAGEANNATTGTAAGTLGGTWSTSYSGSGVFSRQNNGFVGPVLYAEGLGGQGIWTTNTVDISAVGYAIINVDVYSAFVEANDYIRIAYVLDGVETNFYELIGGNGFAGLSSEAPASAIVAGNSLAIKVYVRNDAGGFFEDVYAFDNATITAAPVIYSRKSGTWTDNSGTGTWSLVSHTGAACSCVPLNTQVAIIGNSHTVTLPASQTTVGTPPTTNLAPGAVDVKSTGVLQFNTNGVVLGIVQGLVRVRSGGIINSSSGAITGEQISFNANVGGASLQVDGNVSIQDIVLGSAATNLHYLTGGGVLAVTNSLLINATLGTLTNNFTGTFTLGNRVEFQSGITDGTFVNNQPLTVPTVYFDNDNGTFTNNATLTVNNLQSGANDDDNTFTNSAGVTLTLGTVTPNDGDMIISNFGTINQSGNFSVVDAGSTFTNQSTGVWNWTLTPNTTFDANMSTALNCSTVGNIFRYSAAGDQSIIPTTYYDLTLMNGGTKSTSALLDVDGDLLLQNATTLAPGVNAIDVEGNLDIQNTSVLGGTGAVTVGGNWTAVDATSYTQGTRTTTFDGTAAQAISNGIGTETFYNLTISGSGTKSSTNIIDIDNNLSVAGTAVFSVANDITIAGNWNVTSTNTDPFTEGTYTVTLDGTGTQSISTVRALGETFYNLSITGNNTKSNNSLINIANDLSISTGAATQLSGSGGINIGGDWDITTPAGNTDPFVEGTRTVTFNGAAVQAINSPLAAGEQFYNLTINNSFGTSPQIQPADKITIINALTMTDGNMTSTSTNLVRVLNGGSATIGSANSYIDGPMQFDMAVSGTTRTLNFPIGKSGNWGGVALRVRHSAATSYSYTGEVIHSSAAALSYTLASGTDRVSAIRYWDIRRGATVTPLTTDNANLVTTGAGNAPRITLNYVANDQVNQPTTLTIVKTIGAATAWSDIAGVATGSPTGSVISADVSANFTSFSFFTLANKTGGTNPLPVELVSFNATLNNDEVNLDWRTATEIDNDFFEVERALDLEKFESIGTVTGNGTTNVPHDYSLVDHTPLYGRSYYRLKQTDYDGKHTYSKVVTIDYEGPRFATLRAYPNPADGTSVNVQVTGLRTQQEVPIQIITATGQIVYENTFKVETPGTLSEVISFDTKLRQGLYIIRAGTTSHLTQKLVVD